MKNLKSFIAAILAHCARLSIPAAPAHFVPTPEQLGTLERHGVHKIYLAYQQEAECLVAHVYWLKGSHYFMLPPELALMPNDPLLILRRSFGDFEIRAGRAHHSLSAMQFEKVLDELLQATDFQDYSAYGDNHTTLGQQHRSVGFSH